MSVSDETIAKADWSGEQGERWLANVDAFEAMLAPIGAALLAKVDYQAGERVIDIGCGGGASTRAIARAVAPGGEVLGLDISPDLIAHADKLSADAAGIGYVCGDAAAFALEGEPFDRLHSRFGSMFFDDPHGGFKNLRTLLKPGARMDLAVWAHPRDNPWMMEMMGVVRRHVEIPQADPRAPGPFAFGDLDYLQEVLAAGGFSDVALEAYEGEQAIGGPGATLEAAAHFAKSAVAVGQILAQQPEDVQAAASEDLLETFAKHYREGEGVMLGCKAWLVSAKA